MTGIDGATPAGRGANRSPAPVRATTSAAAPESAAAAARSASGGVLPSPPRYGATTSRWRASGRASTDRYWSADAPVVGPPPRGLAWDRPASVMAGTRLARSRPPSRTPCATARPPGAATPNSTSVGAGPRPPIAPTASAAGAAAGEPIVPNARAPGPSLPAGATTSVPRPAAALTAVASGASSKPAYGELTPTSATGTASEASPSPFGSTARSSPRSRRSVLVDSVGLLPVLLPSRRATRIERIRWRLGSDDASTLATTVPWRLPSPPPDTSGPVTTRPRSPGARAATPESSSATAGAEARVPAGSLPRGRAIRAAGGGGAGAASAP